MSQNLEDCILANLTSSGLPKVDYARFRSRFHIFPNSGRARLTKGRVYVGNFLTRDRKVVVVKTLSDNYLADVDAKRKEKLVQYFEREAGIWRYTESHSNILKLYGYMEIPGQSLPSLISPFYPAGNARGYVENPDHKHLSSQKRIRITKDISRGLEFLHGLSPPIVHRDIRGVNALVDDSSDISVVLIDFGSAKINDPNLFPVFNSTQIFNDSWSPPEYILRPEEFTIPTTYGDIWSLACTCYEIFTARDPYPRRSDMEEMHSKGSLPLRPLGEQVAFSDKLWEFLVCCWSSDPEMRPTAHDVGVELSRLESVA